MNIDDRIASLIHLANVIQDPDNRSLDAAIKESYLNNNWFTEANSRMALNSVAEHFLQADKIRNFLTNYSNKKTAEAKNIALIPAGNIPLVGFHDLLCVYLSGNNAMIKLSSKDEHLTKAILEILYTQNPENKTCLRLVDKLKDFDAVIATGSNNTARYFDYYFKSYPHIIRKNRTSIAVLSDNETDEELIRLGDDVFKYFGLGCRSVSKIYVPKTFDVKRLFELWDHYNYLVDHHKYKNNFDYNNANLLLNLDEFLTNNVFILKEEPSLYSRISVIHYEYYEDLDNLSQQLKIIEPEIQCIATELDLNLESCVPLGTTQSPSLMDYPDGVDSFQFLLDL